MQVGLFKEFGTIFMTTLTDSDILSENNIKLDLTNNVLKRNFSEIKILHTPLTKIYEYIIESNS